MMATWMNVYNVPKVPANQGCKVVGFTKPTKITASVTRLGDLLYFGQLFKACANNYFAQIAFLDNFCKGVKMFHISSGIIFGQLL